MIAGFTPAQTNRTGGLNALEFDSVRLNKAAVKAPSECHCEAMGLRMKEPTDMVGWDEEQSGQAEASEL